jgi:hypothetical protein
MANVLDPSTENYEETLRRFLRQHPDATSEDLAVLLPKAKSPAAVWAKFNATGKVNAGRTKADA